MNRLCKKQLRSLSLCALGLDNIWCLCAKDYILALNGHAVIQNFLLSLEKESIVVQALFDYINV